MLFDDGFHRRLLFFQTAQERALIAGPIKVVAGALGLEIDVALEKIREEPDPDLERD